MGVVVVWCGGSGWVIVVDRGGCVAVFAVARVAARVASPEYVEKGGCVRCSCWGTKTCHSKVGGGHSDAVYTIVRFRGH